MDDATLRQRSRHLRDLVELIAASVYFAKEAQQNYAELGLSYGPGYFCSRSACLGKPPGEVVVAAFGVFNPGIVIPCVDEGWAATEPAAILEARQAGAIASLTRMLEGVPSGVARATDLLRKAGDAGTAEGRPLFAGLTSLGYPGDEIGDLWRAADRVREHRGDSHVVAWTAAGVDAIEITLLTELWWGIGMNSYIATRGWTSEEIEAAIARLGERGLVADGAFTPAGEALRAGIEDATDRCERRLLEALDDTEFDELVGLLEPWGDAVLAARGYPADPRNLTRR